MGFIVGIDVGSGSARCGVFDASAQLLGIGKHPIRQNRPAPGYVEQSSEDIWAAVCQATQYALSEADINGEDVEALSFSATCSLVLLDKDHQPLPLSPGDVPWNIVMWMDHRADEEKKACDATGSPVLSNLGGSMSVEMEIPKLMWVKRNRPDIWAKLGYAGDLADFLCFRSSGTLDRSVCTLGCKWTYDPDKGGWNEAFLREVGLDDLLHQAALPQQAKPIGSYVGNLTIHAASQLGLSTNCRVGMGLIDAHAGALGTTGLHAKGLEQRLALIAGTSNCHIALSKTRTEVPGVWGPYAGAVLEGYYAVEGGQSASGAALDQILSLFGTAPQNTHEVLGQTYLDGLAASKDYGAELCVLPDFLGNRSPFADPYVTASIHGLTLEEPSKMRPKLYGATALGIAFGTRQIIGAMRAQGIPIRQIDLSGGHTQSDLMIRLYADATGCDVFLPTCAEPVLLGAACAAAHAGPNGSVFKESARGRGGRMVEPCKRNAAAFEERYSRFNGLYQ